LARNGPHPLPEREREGSSAAGNVTVFDRKLDYRKIWRRKMAAKPVETDSRQKK
jgi:hypothetical protein